MKGIEIYNVQLRNLGQKYVLGALVPKDNANWPGPWDCAEAAIWAAYQVAGQLYGCANNNGKPNTADAYTGFIYRDVMKLGIKISVEQAARTPGAYLLRVGADGQVGHVATSDGKGGTIEAHSSKTGYIKSVVTGRRWTCGVLIPWIDYDALEAVKTAPPAYIVYRYRTQLMVSPAISQIQAKLKALGFYNGTVDGTFGRQTYEAVRGFQSRKGLNPDGEVGRITAAALGIEI
jgi:N-acetylmuramoyl-L-alanine amidase